MQDIKGGYYGMLMGQNVSKLFTMLGYFQFGVNAITMYVPRRQTGVVRKCTVISASFCKHKYDNEAHVGFQCRQYNNSQVHERQTCLIYFCSWCFFRLHHITAHGPNYTQMNTFIMQKLFYYWSHETIFISCLLSEQNDLIKKLIDVWMNTMLVFTYVR